MDRLLKMVSNFAQGVASFRVLRVMGNPAVQGTVGRAPVERRPVGLGIDPAAVAVIEYWTSAAGGHRGVTAGGRLCQTVGTCG
jgi:hypothetical protein